MGVVVVLAGAPMLYPWRCLVAAEAGGGQSYGQSLGSSHRAMQGLQAETMGFVLSCPLAAAYGAT